MSRPIPKLCRHKISRRGVVRLCGFDHYLGPWPDANSEAPPETRAAYDALIAEWLANGRRPLHKSVPAVPVLTIAALIAAFWKHVEVHYRRPDGTQTSEVDEYRQSLRPLAELYATLPAAEFSPLKLKAVRQRMVDADLCRSVVNRRTRRVVRMFGWAVSEELIPETVHRALETVQALQAGRTLARETEPVGPVPDADVERTLPFLTPALQAVVRLQRLTGMRPGEALAIRPCDVERSDPVWIYRVVQHKGRHRGKARIVALGPLAQEVLRPYLEGRLGGAFCFSPRESMESFRASRHVNHSAKNKRRRKVQPGLRYPASTYSQAIARACRKAGVTPQWHPHQLRHTHATEVRRLFGLEGAQVSLGHAQANITELYAEKDLALLLEIARRLG